jgi:ribonuclease HII
METTSNIVMEATSNSVTETTSNYFTVNKKKPKIIEGMLNSSVEDEEDVLEAGIDEAGRGCLVGRVYAAAVILPNQYPDDKYLEINDSKKLSAKKREELRQYIENIAIDYKVAHADIEEIEDKNILHATMSAMHRALSNLNTEPDNILVDGNYFKQYQDKNGITIPHQTIKKGDTKYRNIAAASILAKVYHDEHVLDLLDKNPDYEKYGWRKNMCYATKQHRDAIEKYGITEFHRKSFGICRNY